MQNFFIQLKNKLLNNIPREIINQLPRGYQKIGDILILSLRQPILPYKKLIAKIILDMIPNTRSICLKKGGIEGQFRKPDLEVIAGDKNTETTHTENNCLFKFDVTKIMFSKGNISERRRIANLVKDDELIIDMFAGIGYFTINIAKHSKPKKIISIELNPIAYNYLIENIKINKIDSIVEAINEDSKKICLEKNGIADRIIMGLLPSPKDYVLSALNALKRPGTIHYEGITNTKKGYEQLLKEFIETSNLAEKYIKLEGYRKIKSYGPKKDHYRIDVRILK